MSMILGSKSSGFTIIVEHTAAIIDPSPFEANIKLVTKPLLSGKHFQATKTGKKN